MNIRFSKTLLLLITLSLIAGLAFGLREYASHRMIADFDEPFYMDLALKYGNAIRDGQYKMVAWIDKNAEHPILGKMVFTVALLTKPRLEKFYHKDLDMLYPISKDAFPYMLAARRTSEVFGVITAVVLALLNPFAGFLIAIQNTAIHYTSAVYLEALPALMSTLSVLCYIVWRKNYDPKRTTRFFGKNERWLLASAIFFGWTVAGKYVFGVAGLAIGIDYIWLHIRSGQDWKKIVGRIVGWGLVAFIIFFIFNPILWPHPVERLIYSLGYHVNYSQSESVTKYNYPFWQPFVWLVKQDKRYHNAFLFNPDAVILVLSAIGLPVTFKKYRVMAIWLVMALAFLLIWNTKWPQYIMMLVTPLCLSAGLALQEILRFIWQKFGKKKDGLPVTT